MIFCSAMHFMIGNSLCSLPQKNQQISITYLNKLCNRREMGSTYIIYIHRYRRAHTSVLIASPASSKIEWKSAYKANAKPQEFSIFARLYHRYIPYIYIHTIYTRYYHISSVYSCVTALCFVFFVFVGAHRNHFYGIALAKFRQMPWQSIMRACDPKEKCLNDLSS